MAKFIIEYNIFLGDAVRFELYDGFYQMGIVQDISQLPDVFIEGYNSDGVYTRWRRGVDSLEVIDGNDFSGKNTWVEIEPSEGVEFVHGEDFNERIVYNMDRELIHKN